MTVIHIGATMIGAEDTIRFDSDVGTLKALARQLLKERNEALEMLAHNRKGWSNLVELNLIKSEYEKDVFIIIDRIDRTLAKARGE